MPGTVKFSNNVELVLYSPDENVYPDFWGCRIMSGERLIGNINERELLYDDTLSAALTGWLPNYVSAEEVDEKASEIVALIKSLTPFDSTKIIIWVVVAREYGKQWCTYFKDDQSYEQRLEVIHINHWQGDRVLAVGSLSLAEAIRQYEASTLCDDPRLLFPEQYPGVKSKDTYTKMYLPWLDIQAAVDIQAGIRPDGLIKWIEIAGEFAPKPLRLPTNYVYGVPRRQVADWLMSSSLAPTRRLELEIRIMATLHERWPEIPLNNPDGESD